MTTAFFDEKETNELVREYFQNRKNPLLEMNIYTALNKICEDLDFHKKFSTMKEIIKNQEFKILEPNFLLTLHCVAVCCDFINQQVLIVQRSSKRSKLSQLWEFGCAKSVVNKSIKNTLEEEYKEEN